jgi:hypothetical protein
MQRRALLLGLGALSACGPKPRPPPPPAPAVLAASELIPADLDVVVRLDFARMKGVLGSVALTALSRQVLSHAGAGAEADELVLASLLGADQVYLGYRPSALLLPLDRVLALQGRFEPLAQTPAGFSRSVDLGGDCRYWEREPGGKLERGEVARIYALGDRVRGFVSEAELDAVERVLAGQGGERRLAPPEEGTLSLAARPWLLAKLSGRGSLRDMLDQARTLYMVVDLESDGARCELELTLESAERARSLAEAGQAVLARLGGRLGPSASLRAAGERVVLSARLSRGELALALGCLQGASDPNCAW